MNLPAFIAARYLFARKKHNIINIISLICGIGIFLGSMSLIVILSVYNGFNTLVKGMYEPYEPNYMVLPSAGKTFSYSRSIADSLENIEGVHVFEVVSENVFVKYGDNQAIAQMKGIPDSYGEVPGLEKHMVEGRFEVRKGDINETVMGSRLAGMLRLKAGFVSPVKLYFPNRLSAISPLDPMSGLNEEQIFPGGLISLNNDFDKTTMFVPLRVARKLLDYADSTVTSLEIFVFGGNAVKSGVLREKIYGLFDNAKYEVKDKYAQNAVLYKMMKTEKFAVYIILFIVIMVVSVNILSSMSMLIIDKKEDIATLSAMGVRPPVIRRIFLMQGWLISVIGALSGVLTGVILCLVQQKFGVISIPGSMIISSYPVDIHIADILITFAGVAAIGYAIAGIPVRSIKK
ncbi:MAG: ABC transporter permease [Bacteroidales bacterium]|jgi:ABC-type lipoprotein release transport system permease subunit|nr:ABC transporter permease [Bacteroidales bacterium]